MSAPNSPDLPISPERASLLAPKLAILLRDFALLAELEAPESEPAAISPWVTEADRDGE